MLYLERVSQTSLGVSLDPVVGPHENHHTKHPTPMGMKVVGEIAPDPNPLEISDTAANAKGIGGRDRLERFRFHLVYDETNASQSLA